MKKSLLTAKNTPATAETVNHAKVDELANKLASGKTLTEEELDLIGGGWPSGLEHSPW